ncbi:MAG TPA: AIR synthase-related protein [Methanolinea sp.]|nr:AIR synthase-related protein [Methanolinea sp.]HQK55698.1 AIR synthase-related protein [Methanolinea sp.]
MDVEEFARKALAAGLHEDAVKDRLARCIRGFKPGAEPGYIDEFAEAVIAEVKNTTGLSGDLFTFREAGVSMGEFGVGSRGTGDFYAHRQIARIIGNTGATVGVDEMDDAGAVPIPGLSTSHGLQVVCTVDGMHSRLSDFPFLAGFHVTRATMRDVYVMGARPLLLFSDIHVADGGDVAKIFEYTAGVCAVGESMGVPLVAGSTLRIGGDMVLGSRMTGCVGTVGIASHLTARREARPGDAVLMTEGAGGGTIATTALYSGYPEVVEQTINLHFLQACEALLASPALQKIHAMTDVTNGGLRGDAHELASTAGCRVVIEEDKVHGLVQEEVGSLLERLMIDPLGVSLDALLITAPPDAVQSITEVIRGSGVRVEEIGFVEAGRPGAFLLTRKGLRDFTPRFRESAYTPVKKVVDRGGRDFDEMKAAVEAAALAAMDKKERMVARLRKRE